MAEQNEKRPVDPRAIFGRWVAVGIALGTALGVAAENIPMGVSTGVALGIAFGFVQQRRKK
ncbi:MAG: glycine zipper family protein [Ignavibacteriae bacterium]|nr:glycine zipper family protein [Ignavibacteriota bacterium]